MSGKWVNKRASVLAWMSISLIHIVYYSIHVPGWLQKWLNLITAPGSVSNEPGSVTWLATKYLKTVSWRNHTENLTTKARWPHSAGAGQHEFHVIFSNPTIPCGAMALELTIHWDGLIFNMLYGLKRPELLYLWNIWCFIFPGPWEHEFTHAEPVSILQLLSANAYQKRPAYLK